MWSLVPEIEQWASIMGKLGWDRAVSGIQFLRHRFGFACCLLLGALCLVGGRTGGDGRRCRNEDEHCECVFLGGDDE